MNETTPAASATETLATLLADPGFPPELRGALDAVAAAPGDEARWDDLEEQGDKRGRPEVVEAAYLARLEAGGEGSVVERIGAKALRFLDEWSGDAALIERAIGAVLAADPAVVWAFERLTMVLTNAERWVDLLALYDRRIGVTTELLARRELLDEAAHIAKDFAGQPDRAIGYLEQLFQMRPSDAGLAASLERLLEARGRHRELVRFWQTRLTVLPKEAAQATRVRVAQTLLDALGDVGEAVAAAEPLVNERAEAGKVIPLLERVVLLEGAASEPRARACALLEGAHEREGHVEDVLRVLEAAARLVAAPAERARIHRKAAGLLEERGELARALGHRAELVVLGPAEDEVARLRSLAESTGGWETFADALARAADTAGDDARAVALQAEAGAVRADRLDDRAGAARLLQQVFWSSATDEDGQRAAGDRLLGLLTATEQEGERLAILERMVGLVAAGGGEQRSLLGEAAQLGTKLGLPARALAAWEQRLALDASDREAIDGRIDALEQLKRWEPLLEALRARAAAAVSEETRRRDLVRIAKVVAATVGDVDRAIEAWREIEARFGREDDTVDSLADLYGKSGQYGELTALLLEAEEAAPRGPRRAELRWRLGDIEREKRGNAAGALELYVNALADDPTSAGARAGLGALLDDAACQVRAVEGLVRATSQSGDWHALLALTEHRLTAAEGDAARVDILTQVAGIEEKEAHDLPAAQRSLGRALLLSLTDRAIEGELLRVAGLTGDWREAAGWLSRTAAALEKLGGLPWCELAMTLAQVQEARLGELDAAFALYHRVVASAPGFPGAEESLVRVGARLGSHDDVARVLVSVAQRSGVVDARLVEAIESQELPAESWKSLVVSLERAAAKLEAQGGVAGSVLHGLHRQAAIWLRDRCRDAAGAERALGRAIEHDSRVEETLEMQVDLQRQHPGAPLIATLSLLSEVRGGDLDALREAALIALDQEGDTARGQALLEATLRVARERWSRGDESRARDGHEAYASLAIERLVTLREQAADAAGAVGLLAAGARLPFDDRTAIALLHRAASAARSQLGDEAQATALYREILARDGADADAIAALTSLYESGGHLADLIALRRHELALGAEPERRLALRLGIARSAQALGDEAQRVEALRENLAEAPGHEASLTEIGAALAGAERFRELAELLASQAATLEAAGHDAVARALWVQAAEIGENRLSDASFALDAQRRAVALGPTDQTLDALARLHTARGEHDQAIPWLEQRLAGAAAAERPEIVQRLAASLTGAGRAAQARELLEQALAAQPGERALRTQLSSIYRGDEAWEAFVSLALAGAEHEADVQAKLSLYLEAADILQRQVGAPGRAVELLRKAAELAPHDRGLRTGLADALRGSGQLAEAQQILEALLEEYGRRRPAERAAVHYQMALLARERGDIEGALAQLDLASSIDMAHTGVLSLLGELAREHGQLERAERAYRALLLTLRRLRPDQHAAVGQGEVAFALSRIVTALGQPERASELLESAFSVATQSSVEATRLELALRKAGEHELLLRAVEVRRERARTPEEEARALSDLARALEQLGRRDEALGASLSAIDLLPDDDRTHEAARALARVAGASERYAGHLRGLRDRALDGGDADRAAGLGLRLGQHTETELGDLPGAVAVYQQLRAYGARVLDVLRALDGAAARAGDRAAQLDALRSLSAALAAGAPAEHAEILYRLADLELADLSTEEQGVATLGWALDRSANRPRAVVLLRRAAARSTSLSLLSLLERVAREAGDQGALLESIERLAALPGPDLALIREGVALADQLGQAPRALALLGRAVEAAPPADATWALVSLGERARAAGDLRAALGWLSRASESATDEEAFRLGLEAASLAADSLKDPALGIQLYDRLWRQHPGDRAAWAPLLALHRAAGDEDAAEALLAGAIPAVADPAERRQLRLERVDLLLASAFRQDEAVGVLQEMIDEDGNDSHASDLLLGLYERTGRTDELAGLLQRQLQQARERGELAVVAAVSRRISALLATSRRADAMAVLREALRSVPEDRSLLADLLALFRDDDDPREHAELVERLLGHETGAAAAKLALRLADLRARSGDEDGVERALSRGLAAAPESDALRGRLEKHYTEREAWPSLAAMLMHDAARQTNPATAVARYRRVATIHRDQLRDPGAATDVLRRARGLAPADLELLADLCVALCEAGEFDEALSEIGQMMASLPEHDPARRALARRTADVYRRKGQEAEAVAALEQAVAEGDSAALPDLCTALDSLRQAAAHRGDAATERAATLRLAGLWGKTGAPDQGAEILWQWTERQGNDQEVLRALLEVETTLQHWGRVIDVGNRLVPLETGADRVAVVLRLAEACAHEGRPGDAREGLEHAYREDPSNPPVRDHLRRLYEQLGAHRELADLCLREAAELPDDASRFDLYKRASELYLAAGDGAAAIPALEGALRAKPTDQDCIVLLADAYTATGQLEQATGLLDSAIAAHKGRRSREVAVLQHRMARVAYVAGDRNVEMAWLNVAIDSDMQNGQVAAELGVLATELGQLDIALKALRAVTMLKTPGPMSKAEGYYRQGLIAYHQGDPRKAVLLAKKALQEDAALAEARAFLDQMGEK
jgi:tetratricopeptide (TPR) repeat protein